MNKEEQMREINTLLRKAAKVYYQGQDEIMTNREYDALYDKLEQLEKETGIILPDSITHEVGYEVISKLEKQKHEEKALSLDKTKDREALRDWLGNNEGVLSWKLDGLTIVLTYDDGQLKHAVTRGNGEIGEIVTHNAKFFEGVPRYIKYKGHLVLRGEALITYSEFNKINDEIKDPDDKYKNPRNLASGTVRQLDSKESSKRKVNFKAFELVNADNVDFTNGGTVLDTHSRRFEWLKEQGFDVVEHKITNKDNILDYISEFETKISKNDFPSDGLVLILNDVKYGKSLGTTGKFPRNGMAFKWADELAETVIRDIEWSASRTGLINPVAVFDPVELEGTTVTRATAHNVSILKKLKLSVGSTITVYKSNMIIPTINENIKPVGTVIIPEKCPVCGEATQIKTSKDKIETLICPNQKCPAKNINLFTHFVSREAMNIEGLSKSTLEKFVDQGFVHSFVDIYHLDDYKNEIINMEGFGEKSYNKLIHAIEKSRNVRLGNLIYALGIPNVGKDASTKISDLCEGDLNVFLSYLSKKFDFSSIDGIGEIINSSIYSWYEVFDDKTKSANLLKLFSILHVVKPDKEIETDDKLEGKVFVITGSLELFANRNALKDLINQNGGKVTGSVSSNTTYLINNDISSSSSKNKKAKELGVPIINEKQFMDLLK